MLIIENKLKKSQIEAIMNGLYKHSLVVPHYYDILKPLKRMVTSKALYFSKVASNGRIGDSILYDAAAQNGVDILKLKTIENKCQLINWGVRLFFSHYLCIINHF